MLLKKNELKSNNLYTYVCDLYSNLFYYKRDSMTCNVCCENFNKTMRKEIDCLACGFRTCTICVKKYIMDTLETLECQCMNCNSLWNMDFLYKILPKSFVEQKIRPRRSNILFQQEISKIPEVIEEAEVEKVYRTLSKEIKELKTEKVEEIRQYLKSTSLANTINNITSEEKFINNLPKVVTTLIQNEKDSKGMISHLGFIDLCGHLKILDSKLDNIFYWRFERNRHNNKKKSDTVFLKPCQINGCKGILNSKWHCGLCDTHVCSKCHIPKNRDDEEHVCKEDDIATADMIAKECRGCPGCNIRVYKIDGCDQMWCTQCHTTFSWKTGKQLDGKIHNPHFLQWLRTNGNDGNIQRDPEDVVCGGMPHYVDIYKKLRLYSDEFYNQVTTVYRFCVELRQNIPDMHMKREQLMDFRKFRIDYIVDPTQFTEKQFMSIIKRRDKSSQKLYEKALLHDTYCTLIEEEFRKFVLCEVHPVFKKNPPQAIYDIYNEMKKIYEFLFQSDFPADL